MKKILFLSLLLWILSTASMNAQVNIGSDVDPHDAAILDLSQSDKPLGFLLPRVQLADVNQFQLPGYNDPAKVASAIGMVVYNTSPSTKGAQGIVGKFVWDGTQWRALAIDGGMMNLEPADYPGSQGNEIDAENPQNSSVSIVNSNCDISGNYVFSLIAGDEYASISPISSIIPQFNVEFLPNETGFERKAIVLATNPCGKTGTFVFSQKAAACASNIHPAIATYFDAVSNANGSVHAYVSGLTPSDDIHSHEYYWMFNNTLVAKGAGVALTTPGTYSVYVDQIGCGTAEKITITGSSDRAPESKHIIASNEGIICGTSGKVKLSALNAGTDDIWWFKDGIRQGNSPNSSYELVGEAGEGVWYAVTVDNSNRASIASNKITVSYQNEGNPIAAPVATVNGVDLTSSGSIVLCADGTMILEVTNRTDATYVNPVFTWYANDQILGESDGKAIYVVPSNLKTVVISVKATVMGLCPTSTTSSEIVVDRVNTPAATVINGGAANAYICGTHPATLIAAVQNGTQYEWFKSGDTTPIPGATANIYKAGAEGAYSVRYVNASGCWSRISPDIQVSLSNAITLLWSVKPESNEILESSKTYSVLGAPNPFEYRWSSTPQGIATITPLGNGTSALVTYGSTATSSFEISVSAKNGCGETQITSGNIVVEEGCIPASAVTITSTAPETKVGEPITFSATVNAGTAPFTYQWYLDNQEQIAVTGDTYVFTPNANQTGTHSIAVKVSNKCTAPGKEASAVETLTVNNNPNLASPVPPANVHTIFMDQKTCLDVRKTGDAGTNSWLGDRLPLNVRPDDFTTLRNGTYDFTYKFAGSGTGYSVSTVDYIYKDPNHVISEVSGSGTNSAILKFKPEIVGKATGRTKDNPIKVTLYAIYIVNNTAYKDSVDIVVQDGACGCPAKMTATTWKMDFCYAAGADYTKDPYVMHPDIYGAYYKWGNKTPAATYYIEELNRVTASTDLIWNMEMQNPCPQGWRVPTRTELDAISDNSLNPRKTVQTLDADGYRGQLRGYVPISGGGYRSTGSGDRYLGGIHSGNNGYTWSSTARSSTSAYSLTFSRTGSTGSDSSRNKNYGEHVRCISEGNPYSGN